MEIPRRTRHTTILIGIGLVLIGLLGGILVMLLVFNVPEARSPLPVVERVELGRNEPLRPVSVPDSVRQDATVDMFALNRMFKLVAEHVTPAVVYIQVEGRSGRDMPRDWFHDFDDEDLRERFFRDMPRQSVGSGVIISDQGYVVTNHHVVDQASEILVTLSDKRQFGGHIVGVDRSTDLAVIKLDHNTEDLPVVALGNSDTIDVGEWVLAVGNPFRLTSTVTAGIVSALGRQVNIIDDAFSIEDFIQTDAAINPGNSGGALVNLHGELVGISTAIATESGSYEGYGFAVPVNLMERVVRDLIAYGEVQRGYLGVSIQGIDARAARELGLDRVGGVYLRDVERGGAAHRGGLRRGDVVLSVQGHGVDAPNELQSYIARHRPGDHLALEVWRRGRTQRVQVELLGKDDPAYRRWFQDLARATEPGPEANPHTPPPEVFELGNWGLGLRTLTNREQDGFDLERGVYLAYVEKGTMADRADLPRDVVIQRIGDDAVSSVEEAVRLLGVAADTADAVLLQVKRRDGLTAFYEVDVPEK